MNTNLKQVVQKTIALFVTMMLFMTTIMVHTNAQTTLTSNSTASVEIKGVENGATVHLYKIIDVAMKNQQPIKPVYTWRNSVITNYFDKNENDKATYVGEANSVKGFETANADAEKMVLEHIKNALMNANPAVVADHTMNATGTTVTFPNVEMGEYLVVVSKQGSTRSYALTSVKLLPTYNQISKVWELNSLTNTDAVQVKSSSTSLTKSVDDETVCVGQKIAYTLSFEIPGYPSDATSSHSFKISDSLGEGLHYTTTHPTTVTSLKVYLKGGVGTPDTLVDSSNYTVNRTLATTPVKESFTVDFTTKFAQDHSGKQAYIEYDVTVNEKAFTNKAALENTASLVVYDPYGGTSSNPLTAKEQVYTYGVNITKQAKLNNGTNPEKLAGAAFRVYLKDASKPDRKGKEVIFVKTNPNAEGDYTVSTNQAGTGIDLITVAEGKLFLAGLTTGTYILEEVKAPGKYHLPKGHIEFTIKDEKDVNGRKSVDGNLDDQAVNQVTTTGTAEVDKGTISYTAHVEKESTNVLNFTVYNDNTGVDLPNTGGMGTVIFTVGGMALMVVGGFFLFATKKRNDEE